MTSQKHLFDLPPNIHYLNGAYMSPIPKSVYEAGLEGTKRKLQPWDIHSEDFFSEAEGIKAKFGKLIHAPARQIAIIPSASYGLKSAIQNIPTDSGKYIVTIANEFPSDYYTIAAWCKQNKKEVKIIQAPNLTKGKGAAWTEKIVDAITNDTAAVVLSTIHWTYGTRFDLKQIGEKCKIVYARFIADGTLSVGALPIDVIACNIDALVCAAYKWLMGPYSIGLAYYGEVYNGGTPIEDSWMNRSNAHDFTTLTQYVNDYLPGAARYNVGEFSNHVLLPMLDRALQQVAEWGPESIQNYCRRLIEPLLYYFRENGYWLEQDEYRADHLFGVLLPASLKKDELLKALINRNVFVSVRGDAIRISPHVYNDSNDITMLINVLKANR